MCLCCFVTPARSQAPCRPAPVQQRVVREVRVVAQDPQIALEHVPGDAAETRSGGAEDRIRVPLANERRQDPGLRRAARLPGGPQFRFDVAVDAGLPDVPAFGTQKTKCETLVGLLLSNSRTSPSNDKCESVKLNANFL